MVEKITAERFDEMFDNGEDISEYLDWSRATRPGMEPRHLDVDVPAWMVRDLDALAEKRGVSRQALIEAWLADRLRSPG